MECSLIFPHQLFWPHPAVTPDRPVFLVEDPLFFGPDVRWPTHMHRQKLILHRASMQAYAARLQENGHRTTLLPCPGIGHTEQMLEDGLPRDLTALHLVDPVDDLLSRRLQKFSERRGLACRFYASPQFLTPAAFLDECFGRRAKPLMAHFYAKQRQRLGVLIAPDGSPQGGRWSFDSENRRKLPRGVPIPSLPAEPTENAEEIARTVAAGFPESRGHQAPFFYPTTHHAAESWLDQFLQQRLTGFGLYEDAISARHPVLFHSVLTPALNIGLLNPQQVLDRTLAYASSHPVPLNSLEGFIRQIIGWREFMRAMYERHGRRMRRSNFWGHQRRMPRSFYDGTTGIAPVDHTIRRVLATGYCHHIERLMLLGNFMLLCRIHPDEVYRWFMEMFIDSYDWVMVPNVYGMSQYADGGSFTTKPYISGSNYILKMSDYPRGPWCEIWDALFWTFIADHREVFLRNPRLSMMARLCDRLGDQLPHHRQIAEKFLGDLS